MKEVRDVIDLMIHGRWRLGDTLIDLTKQWTYGLDDTRQVEFFGMHVSTRGNIIFGLAVTTPRQRIVAFYNAFCTRMP